MHVAMAPDHACSTGGGPYACQILTSTNKYFENSILTNTLEQDQVGALIYCFLRVQSTCC